MSFPSSHDSRRRPFIAGNSVSPHSRRTALGYWIPLAFIVSTATLGIAAWIWSERSNDDDGDYPRDGQTKHSDSSGAPGRSDDGYAQIERNEAHAISAAADTRYEEEASMIDRMHGALRRTPSPQQIFDGASKRVAAGVAAGVAAAGAFMSAGLTSIREENRGDFEDHSRWSEEVRSRADERSQQAATSASGMLPVHPPSASIKNKTIAIVLSSVLPQDNSNPFNAEPTSILTQIPDHINSGTYRIFILIYAPSMRHAVGQGSPPRPAMSITSSYSNISVEDVVISDKPVAKDSFSAESREIDNMGDTGPLFKMLYSRALALVERENMIMSFSTATGYVHLVRHLSPDLVYVQEALTGNEGEAVHHISGWVRQVVVAVEGESGHDGVAGSDDRRVLPEKVERWWQKEGATGVGKRIEVVDVLRIGDDWRRRLRGQR